MKDDCEVCRYEKMYSMQFDNLREDLKELKERVQRLESTLARGVLLLVANLVGVVMTLVQQVMRS